MSQGGTSSRKFALHGLATELACEVGELNIALDRMLASFEVGDLPQQFTPAAGSVRPYEEAEVLRHLSSSADPLEPGSELVDIYQEGERFWLVDERWGLAEINFLQNRWRSWVLPRPTTDPERCAEMAVLWPMAQLLRNKGLHLLPAVAMARGEWGVLLFSSFSLEPELRAMIGAGFRVIGERWTAVREDARGIELLHLPGHTERACQVQMRGSTSLELGPRVDLAEEYGAAQSFAFCRAVIVAEPGRRGRCHINQLQLMQATEVLRRVWPITELHPRGRRGQLPARLAQRCGCYSLQLSRNTDDLLLILDSLQHRTTGVPPVTSPALKAPPPVAPLVLTPPAARTAA